MSKYEWSLVQGLTCIEIGWYANRWATQQGVAVPEMEGLIAADSHAEVMIHWVSSASFTAGDFVGQLRLNEERVPEKVQIIEYRDGMVNTLHEADAQLTQTLFERFEEQVWKTTLEF